MQKWGLSKTTQSDFVFLPFIGKLKGWASGNLELKRMVRSLLADIW
jgi:hypothetical protein